MQTSEYAVILSPRTPLPPVMLSGAKHLRLHFEISAMASIAQLTRVVILSGAQRSRRICSCYSLCQSAVTRSRRPVL